MKKSIIKFIACVIILNSVKLQAKLMINEVSTSGNPFDWVEIYYNSDKDEKLEISNLFVTTYYGNNEALSNEPITIYSRNRPETPYDDRFIVINFVTNFYKNENDFTGDTDQNGRMDLYCKVSPGILWNTEGIIAIDTNNDPSDGMIDFIAYSNMDNSLNSTVKKNLELAIANSQWIGIPNQQNMINITKSGLSSYQSIIRNQKKDTNSTKDFQVTNFSTAGKENYTATGSSSNKKNFSLVKKRITFFPGQNNKNIISFFCYKVCKLNIRLFNSIGQLIYESKSYNEYYPGNHSIEIPFSIINRCRTGLYIVKLNSVTSSGSSSQSENIFIIISRYR